MIITIKTRYYQGAYRATMKGKRGSASSTQSDEIAARRLAVKIFSSTARERSLHIPDASEITLNSTGADTWEATWDDEAAQALADQQKAFDSWAAQVDEWLAKAIEEKMTEGAVICAVMEAGCKYRVVIRDGIPSFLTADLNSKRVNLEVTGGIVTRAYRG